VSAEQLETAADALGPILAEVVFLGGASIHIWLSDPAAPPTRATDDVDVISAITTRTGYYRLAERLRTRGFTEADDSNVICRWRHQTTGLLLDVMPQEPDVLGFSNPWYRHAIETAVDRRLPSKTRIRAATPPDTLERAFADNQSAGELDAGTWTRQRPPRASPRAACSWSSPRPTPGAWPRSGRSRARHPRWAERRSRGRIGGRRTARVSREPRRRRSPQPPA
jgi:hypothetical protein